MSRTSNALVIVQICVVLLAMAAWGLPEVGDARGAIFPIETPPDRIRMENQLRD